MGQYYMPVVIKGRKQKVHVYYSHNFSCGLKITEHAYFNNDMVRAIMLKLMNNPHHVAWMGDYSEVTKLDKNNNYRPIPHSLDDTPFEKLQWTSEFYKDLDEKNKKTVKEVICNMGSGFIRDTDEYMRYFQIAHKPIEKSTYEPDFISLDTMFAEYDAHHSATYNKFLSNAEIKGHKEALAILEPYAKGFLNLLNYAIRQFVIVNHTKKQYIHLGQWWNLYNTYDGWADRCYHPLPLLTACGNGLGGGDFFGLNQKMCGYWAFDYIGVYHETNVKKFKGFADMKGFGFIEKDNDDE